MLSFDLQEHIFCAIKPENSQKLGYYTAGCPKGCSCCLYNRWILIDTAHTETVEKSLRKLNNYWDQLLLRSIKNTHCMVMLKDGHYASLGAILPYFIIT
jgi:hypothetical protein